jgi:hypothetical protein
MDMLDGGSERLFDQMKLVALHVLGLPVPKGRPSGARIITAGISTTWLR